MKNGKASILVIAAGCLWGLIGLFTRRMTAAGLDAIQITVLRSLVTAVGLEALLLWKDRGKCRIVGKDIWMFMGTGICSIAAFNTLYFITMEQTTLSLAVVLLYTAPFFVLLLSAVCFGEKLTRQKWKGLLLALIGCICTTGVLHGGLKKALPPFPPVSSERLRRDLKADEPEVHHGGISGKVRDPEKAL